ncbi:DUF5655 domain-containing protein [Streptomyces sp. MS19]|uniref:DUF5655 domain-containing protein n=1 Tax=Streptomyces sp. MS19 TaxID=3385972 RepID=UPI0039A2564B
MSGVRLFDRVSGVVEVLPRLAEVEADVQGLVEAHMETMLGVRFLASEFSTGPVHGGRIDSLGLDENNAPVIVEYKRGTDAGVIHQGLFYLAWLVDHPAEFHQLVRDRLGAEIAAQIVWRAPRLICVAGDFTRYDIHAVREHRRSIDLVRYRFFGDQHVGLEAVASVTGNLGSAGGRSHRPTRDAAHGGRCADGAMAELEIELDEMLRGLGDDVTTVQRKTYRAYQRLRNFACVCPPRQKDLLVYVKADPKSVELVPGFTRDVTGLGHHGTGDLELRLASRRHLDRAHEVLRMSYAGA